jgi:hypothetical protein
VAASSAGSFVISAILKRNYICIYLYIYNCRYLSSRCGSNELDVTSRIISSVRSFYKTVMV